MNTKNIRKSTVADEFGSGFLEPTRIKFSGHLIGHDIETLNVFQRQPCVQFVVLQLLSNNFPELIGLFVRTFCQVQIL